MDADVVIVGAGLAGLSCAVRLHEAGRAVVVLEAADAAGGRVRTDEVDGFRLDRGFQVLLTGYPALQARFDLDALDLRAFSPGVVIHHRGRFQRLADPLRAPVAGLGALRSPVLSLGDARRLLAWRWSVTRGDGSQLTEREQVATGDLLRRRGFSPRLQSAFLRPFLSGIFFDQELSTSSRVTELVFRSFFRGVVAVPAGGMQRLPEQLAARLPDDAVRCGQRVEAVADGDVVVDGGHRVRADHVVVATEGPAAAELLQDRIPGRPPAPGRGATTVYFRAPTSPIGAPHLVLEADGGGPVTTLAAMSDVAPEYAPDGSALVAASLTGVPNHGDDQLARIVRAQLHGWYGDQVSAWELLRIYRIPYAQPRQDVVDLPRLAREVQVDDRTWVCGDHRDTGSIQGALVSGRRTAEAILAG